MPTPESTRLVLLKADLGLRSPDVTQTTYLNNLLEIADSRVSKRGIALTEGNIDHDQLVAMYAAYLYRCRAEDKPMPRMLVTALNDELCRQKMEADE